MPMSSEKELSPEANMKLGDFAVRDRPLGSIITAARANRATTALASIIVPYGLRVSFL